MGTGDSQDLRILEAVNRWDDGSMKMLYEQYYRALVLFCKRLTGDLKVAEEIVQDTFLKVWQKRNVFQSTGALKAYLYNSVRNAGISHLRHEKVERSRIEALEREFSLMQTDDNGELLLHREDIFAQLLKAIDSLPAKQRELFLLSIQGKTGAEIAEIVGISHDLVRKQRQRGIARLRELLSPEAFLLLLFLIR